MNQEETRVDDVKLALANKVVNVACRIRHRRCPRLLSDALTRKVDLRRVDVGQPQRSSGPHKVAKRRNLCARTASYDRHLYGLVGCELPCPQIPEESARLRPIDAFRHIEPILPTKPAAQNIGRWTVQGAHPWRRV